MRSGGRCTSPASPHLMPPCGPDCACCVLRCVVMQPGCRTPAMLRLLPTIALLPDVAQRMAALMLVWRLALESDLDAQERRRQGEAGGGSCMRSVS